MGFVNELKRRNVFRAAAAYALVAWLLVQIGEAVFPAFGVPDSIFRGMVIALLMGFPFVLLVSWAYEMTPEGVKRDRNISSSVAGAAQTGRKLDFIIIGLLIVAVAYFALDKFLLQPKEAPSEITALTDFDRSVAALPFVNHGGDDESQAFASGMHDDLLTQLAKIPGLRVISRTSVREYANTEKNIRQIADELSVKHILEGGVQKAGDRVRVNVQLINAKDDSHLWAETFDRELTTANIFAIQSEIAHNISNVLQITLSPETAQALTELPTDNIDAYGYYISAISILNDSSKWMVIDERNHAIDLLQSAVDEDPQFALAWIRMADTMKDNLLHGGDDEALRMRYLAALAQAETIAPDLPEMHMLRARQKWYENRQEEALEELDLAMRGSPGNAEIYRRRYWVNRRLGRNTEALSDLQRALVLDPRDEFVLQNYAMDLTRQRRYQEARDELAKAIAAFPTKWLFRESLAAIDLYQFGDMEPYRKVWLRSDAPREAAFYAFMVARLAWIAGDIETALTYAGQATAGFTSGETFLTAEELNAWIFHDAGMEAESKRFAEQAEHLIRDEIAVREDDSLPLLALARLSILEGDNTRALDLARQGLEAAESRKGLRDIYVYQSFWSDYGDVLCAAGDLSAAEDAFRWMLSRENELTLASLVLWPPCKQKMLGTKHYQRLEREFGHLSNSISSADR